MTSLQKKCYCRRLFERLINERVNKCVCRHLFERLINIRVNIFGGLSIMISPYFFIRSSIMKINIGNFYFIKDDFFELIDDLELMQNKEKF